MVMDKVVLKTQFILGILVMVHQYITTTQQSLKTFTHTYSTKGNYTVTMTAKWLLRITTKIKQSVLNLH